MIILTLSLFSVTKIVQTPFGTVFGMALIDNERVAVLGYTAGQYSVRTYSLARGCELSCAELEGLCPGITFVKVGEKSALALAFPLVIFHSLHRLNI